MPFLYFLVSFEIQSTEGTQEKRNPFIIRGTIQSLHAYSHR